MNHQHWLLIRPSTALIASPTDFEATLHASQKWGWGWSSEVCWHCLSDLEQGWETLRKYPYKPYGEYSYDDD